MLQKQLLILVCLVLLSQQVGQIRIKEKLWIDPSSRVIRDSENRHVILHGVNVVYKVAPYIPSQNQFDSQNSLNDEDIDNLVSWGFNLVRLGVMWEAIEYSPGQYNHTYIQEVNTLINKLGKKGIYTLVDAHQDVLARTICGEGMPNFYAKNVISKGTQCIGKYFDKLFQPILSHFGICKSIDQYNFKQDKDGNPLISECQKYQFQNYYSSPESITLFKAFYQNDFGIQDKYIAYWIYVSQQLSSNKYVIGFDPFNEPFPAWGSFTDLFKTLYPGNFDKNKLSPLYKRINEQFMKVSEDNIMYFEPSQFPDSVEGFVFTTGFSSPPGGKVGSPNHVLNDHTYCCQLGLHICDSGEPTPGTQQQCLEWHRKNLRTRNQDAKRLGIPMIFSEFGACLDSQECVIEISQVTDACDTYLTSWAYWQFKTFKDLTTSAFDKSEGFYNKDGTLQQGKVKALARTYVQRAQGTIQNMIFISQNSTDNNPDSILGTFKVDIKIDMSIDYPTIIYLQEGNKLNQTWYPNGAKINVFSKYPNKIKNPKYEQQIDKNKIQLKVIEQEFNEQILSIEIIPLQQDQERKY